MASLRACCNELFTDVAISEKVSPYRVGEAFKAHAASEPIDTELDSPRVLNIDESAFRNAFASAPCSQIWARWILMKRAHKLDEAERKGLWTVFEGSMSSGPFRGSVGTFPQKGGCRGINGLVPSIGAASGNG